MFITSPAMRSMRISVASSTTLGWKSTEDSLIGAACEDTDTDNAAAEDFKV
jgi:hypothetical protein